MAVIDSAVFFENKICKNISRKKLAPVSVARKNQVSAGGFPLRRKTDRPQSDTANR